MHYNFDADPVVRLNLSKFVLILKVDKSICNFLVKL